jgi:Domain of unknown function (DUF1830)
MLCYYTNTTIHTQVARITNIDRWYLERVIVPKASLIFEAPPAARLDIYSSQHATCLLSDKIECKQLQV